MKEQRMWAVVGPADQGIIGIDKDFDKAWGKALLFTFDAENADLAGMKEFLQRQGCTCRELEVKEVEG